MEKEHFILLKAKALENLVSNDLMYRYDPVGLRMRTGLPEGVARRMIDKCLSSMVADLGEVSFELPLEIIERVKNRQERRF